MAGCFSNSAGSILKHHLGSLVGLFGLSESIKMAEYGGHGCSFRFHFPLRGNRFV